MVDFRSADDPLNDVFEETRIRGYGTVNIQPSPASGESNQLMTLKDVAYVSGFLAKHCLVRIHGEIGVFVGHTL